MQLSLDSKGPSKAEAGLAGERGVPCPKAKAKQAAKDNLELGAAAAVLSFAVAVGYLCLPNEAKHLGNVRLIVSLLMAFLTFVAGISLVILTMHMAGLRENLVSDSQRIAAKCLVTACHALPVLTLLSLLVAFLPGRVWYIGLTVCAVVLLLVVVLLLFLHHRRRRSDGDDEPTVLLLFLHHRRRRSDGDDEPTAHDEELHKEELDAASKVTSGVTISGFSGLVGVIYSTSKVPAKADGATYAAIFFMFATAILGIFVVTVSKRMREVIDTQYRQFLVTAIRLANALLLSLLACAALAAAFAVVRYRMLASFAPFAIAAMLCLLRQCAAGSKDRRANENPEARFKEMEDLASKVTMAMLGGIMSVFGASLGEKGRDKASAIDVFIVVLTTTFVSGFGFMLLANVPRSARAFLTPATGVLFWSSIVLLAATAVAACGAEIWRS